ncbi:MAG: hypothetical protein ACI93R_003993 [Flavobacteriales bacterium]|jgi:uncharacterized protein YqiB (DUF1249 family)
MYQSDYVLLKDRVTLDLVEHLSICEFNYHAFMSILPGLLDGREQWHFGVGETVGSKLDYLIVHAQLLERSPYTSFIGIDQDVGDNTLPTMKVRLYHDAKVAEIISWGGHRHWQPLYEYPNPKMYQPDEKQAVNRFVRDWLVFCRKTGFSLGMNCDSVLVRGK